MPLREAMFFLMILLGGTFIVGALAPTGAAAALASVGWLGVALGAYGLWLSHKRTEG